MLRRELEKVELTSSFFLHVANQRELLSLRHRGVRPVVVPSCCWLWGLHLGAKAGFGGVCIVAMDCFGGVWDWFGSAVAWRADTVWGSTAGLPCLLRDVHIREELRVELVKAHHPSYFAGCPVLSSRPHCCYISAKGNSSSTHLFVAIQIHSHFNTYRTLCMQWLRF